MRYLLLLLISMALSCAAQAQQEVQVVLKSGKVLKGRLTNSVYEDFITLEQSALERQNIAIEKVQSIHFGAIPDTLRNDKQKDFFKREPAYFHLSEFYMLLGRDSDGSGYTNLSVHTVNGYAFSPHLMLGGGIGLDKYGDFLVAPLYLSVRGLIVERSISPFYYANLGWGHMWITQEIPEWIDYHDTDGGYHFQAGLGYQFNMKASAITLGLGYRLQKTHLHYSTQTWGWGTETEIEEDRLLRRFAISLGLTF
ncbi:hypothetical protein PZB74_19375 [Porifericola rhodea]|uniref:hypothetical protein n=1 Tax=Porifericola rhodea TaxID=930972 RepID=UPI002666A6D9|nr:hypothetical protein [Porifericola rhodea]WKN31115.1 hypothetical protein PZB74_19375 [Porifericola rhodea]